MANCGKNMVKIISVLVLSVLFLAAFGVQISLAAAQSEKAIVLKFVTAQNNTEFHYKAGYEPMIQEIERESKGKIKIDYYPSETLVKIKATPEAIQQGIADIGYITPGYHPAMFPLNDVWNLPMLFTSAVNGWEMDHKLGAKFWNPMYAKSGFISLGRYLTAPYHVYTTRREIRGLKDLSGLRLKTPGAPGTALLKSLGAQGILLSAWDTYESLSKGTLDGVVHAPAFMRTAKWNELGKPGYLLMGPAGISGSSSGLIMNKKVYDGLSPELKKVMDLAGEHWGHNISKEYDNQDNGALAEFKKSSMVITKMSGKDQEQLKALSGPVLDQWVADNQAKGHPAKELLAEVRRMAGGAGK